jgi:hypothetical protein
MTILDDEIEALGHIVDLLSAFDPATQDRLVGYLFDRYHQPVDDVSTELRRCRMTPVEQYAIDLVVAAIEDHAEDDLNEDGKLTDGDHELAISLAMALAKAIRSNPDQALYLPGSPHAS